MYQVIRAPVYLEHHGIKGMHWGVWNEETRARRKGLRKLRRKKKNPYDYSNLTDQELQQRLNRKRNEDQLRQLEKKEDGKSFFQVSEDGLKRVRNILGSAVGITASAAALAATYPKAAEAVNRMLNRHGSTYIKLK